MQSGSRLAIIHSEITNVILLKNKNSPVLKCRKPLAQRTKDWTPWHDIRGPPHLLLWLSLELLLTSGVSPRELGTIKPFRAPPAHPETLLHLLTLPLLCESYRKSFLLTTGFFPLHLTLYSWALNNMGLNCAGPLIRGFLSTVDATVLHDSWLAESSRCKTTHTEEPQYRRLTVKLHPDFLLHGGSASLTPALLEGSIVFLMLFSVPGT